MVRRRAPGILPWKSQLESRKLRSSGSPPKMLGSDPLNNGLWLASRMRSVHDADCAAAMLWRKV